MSHKNEGADISEGRRSSQKRQSNQSEHKTSTAEHLSMLSKKQNGGMTRAEILQNQIDNKQ